MTELGLQATLTDIFLKKHDILEKNHENMMMSISGIKRSIIKEPDPSFEDSSSDGSGFCHAEETGKRMLAVL